MINECFKVKIRTRIEKICIVIISWCYSYCNIAVVSHTCLSCKFWVKNSHQLITLKHDHSVFVRCNFINTKIKWWIICEICFDSFRILSRKIKESASTSWRRRTINKIHHLSITSTKRMSRLNVTAPSISIDWANFLFIQWGWSTWKASVSTCHILWTSEIIRFKSNFSLRN